jgi:hypothetical protein
MGCETALLADDQGSIFGEQLGSLGPDGHRLARQLGCFRMTASAVVTVLGFVVGMSARAVIVLAAAAGYASGREGEKDP